MIRSRSAFSMPAYRPRRIWLNGVGAQNGTAKEAELRKSLPYCDTETGTKNRVVERDPISGLGLLGKEYDPFLENRQKTKSPRDKDGRNPILGEGNLGQEANPFNRPDGYKTSRTSRNPLDQSVTTDRDADSLRPKGRPGKVSILQAQRDPISGRGEFGREWDPIHKYTGRPRQWHQRAQDAKRGGRCNPVTGEDANSFDINKELKRTPRKGSVKKSNPVTGENCDSYTVSDKLNEKHLKTGVKKGANGGNPVTGENCKSFDFNVESKPATPRRPATQGGNPVTGENCTVYAYSREFKVKPNKPNGEAKNPLTGANCQSFSVSNEERPRTAPGALSTPRSNSNPVTGEGCQHFVVCNGEKKVSTAAQQQQLQPKEAPGNPLTGTNMRSFDINRELRVNRRAIDNSKPVENGHHSHHTNGNGNGNGDIMVQSARGNPITGEGMQ